MSKNRTSSVPETALQLVARSSVLTGSLVLAEELPPLPGDFQRYDSLAAPDYGRIPRQHLLITTTSAKSGEVHRLTGEGLSQEPKKTESPKEMVYIIITRSVANWIQTFGVQLGAAWDRITSVQPTTPPAGVCMPAGIQPEQLKDARFKRPSTIVLTFADGFTGRLSLSQLEIDSSEVNLPKTRTLENGLEFEVVDGKDTFVIDSATLRYVVDQVYAANLDERISHMLPSEQLERIAKNHQPPQEWYDQAESMDD